NGIIVSVIRVPSFIVTLAGFLGYEGVLQHVLQPNDSIRISDQGLLGIASGYMPEYLSIALPLIAVGLYAAYIVWQRISRQRKQLYVSSWGITAVRIAVVAVPVVLALFVYENYYGVPYLAAIMIGLVVLFWIILRFTTFGRHVYAVGGNTEAARRAGIPVVRTRIIIFTLTSLLAGVAGDLEAMRQTTATALVSPNLLLEAIAAAVIGGVSLFGG